MKRRFRVPRRPFAPRGFTLIELLVVIGLIVLFVGSIGLSLGDSRGRALATAQQTVAALVARTRAQAALHQTDARLVVYGTRPPAGAGDKFLRLLQVFRADPADSGTWMPVDAPVYLPRGVFVVPPSPDGLIAGGLVWPGTPPLASNLATGEVVGQTVGSDFADAGNAFFLEFKPGGSLARSGDATHIRIVLATAAIATNGPLFDNPGAVRGVVVRGSGAIGFVHDPASF